MSLIGKITKGAALGAAMLALPLTVPEPGRSASAYCRMNA